MVGFSLNESGIALQHTAIVGPCMEITVDIPWYPPASWKHATPTGGPHRLDDIVRNLRFEDLKSKHEKEDGQGIVQVTTHSRDVDHWWPLFSSMFCRPKESNPLNNQDKLIVPHDVKVSVFAQFQESFVAVLSGAQAKRRGVAAGRKAESHQEKGTSSLWYLARKQSQSVQKDGISMGITWGSTWRRLNYQQKAWKSLMRILFQCRHRFSLLFRCGWCGHSISSSKIQSLKPLAILMIARAIWFGFTGSPHSLVHWSCHI